MRKRILVMLSAMPWPPRQNGLGMRFAPLIEVLSERHDVDVVITPFKSTHSLPESYRGKLKCSVEIHRPRSMQLPVLLRKLRTAAHSLWPWGKPYGWVGDRSVGDLVSWLTQKVRAGKYDIILMGGLQYDIAGYVRNMAPKAHLVLDVVDSPTLMTRRWSRKRGAGRIFDAYSTWKVMRLERKLLHWFDALIYISEVDATTVHAPGVASVIPNGVLADDISGFPAVRGKDSDGTTIGFLGNMSYGPNVEAALRLARNIFPVIAARRPGTRLLIIGRDPLPEITALGGADIEVTGTVPDIWPLIRRTDLFLFPMLSGAGLQNKILDAMLGQVPTVTTGLAAAGLGAVKGRDLLVAESDAEFCNAAVDLLNDVALRQSIVANASRLLEAQFFWPAIAERYAATIGTQR
jgi:polysaccharide biosynthesis protein PslH